MCLCLKKNPKNPNKHSKWSQTQEQYSTFHALCEYIIALSTLFTQLQ